MEVNTGASAFAFPVRDFCIIKLRQERESIWDAVFEQPLGEKALVIRKVAVASAHSIIVRIWKPSRIGHVHRRV